MPDKPYTHGAFCWHELGTRDAATAKKFYGEIARWTTQDVPMGEMGTYTLLKLGDKDVAGLYEMQGPQFEGVPPHWMSYVWVDDVDATARKAESLGAKPMMPPMDVPNVGRIAVLQDPTGAHIALFKGSQHPGAVRPENPLGSFCWNELLTRDTKRATDFYTQLFNWTPDVQDMGQGPYTIWKQGDVMCGGMMAIAPEWGEVPPHWLGYIAVSDCEAAVKKTQDLGGSIKMPPMDVPNVGRFSIIQDPTGGVVSVIKLQS